MRRGENLMKLDSLIVMRRTLKAVQGGLPIERTLLLIESLLDGLGDNTTWEYIDHLVKAALLGDHEWISDMCKELQGIPPHREEEREPSPVP
jgi:hypothetical protein